MKHAIYIALIALISIQICHAQDSPQWQLPHGAKMRLGKGNLYDFDYSPDGTKIAIATSIGIWIYDAQTGEELKLISDADSEITKIAYSLDGNTILSDIDKSSLCLWDAETGEKIRWYWGHSHPQITALTFSPDGKTFASGGIGSSVRIWEIATGRQLHRLSGPGSAVTSIAYSPDGQIIATSGGRDEWIRLYDPYTGSNLRLLIGHNEGVSSLAFSMDGKTLASSGYDNTVRLWDVDAALTYGVANPNIQRDIIRRHTDSVYDITYSQDGRYFATASKDKNIRLWDASNLNIRYTFRSDTHYPLKIALSPDNHTLVSRNSDNTIRLRYNTDGIDGRFGWRERIITGYTDISIDTIDISPDGNTLVAEGENYTLSLWDVDTGTQQDNLVGHTSDVNSIAFSPINNNLIASGSDDGTMRLWHADTATERKTLISVVGDVESVAFSPDGSTVACAITYGEYNSQYYLRDSNIHLFDVETGTALITIAAHIAPPSASEKLEVHPTRHVRPVYAITFTPHGEALISISSDNTIRFWNTRTGAHARVIAGKTCPSGIMAFSPNGKILACDDWDDNIHLWDVQTNTLLQTLTGHTEGVSQVEFSPDATTLASSSYDGTVRVWDVNMGVILSTFAGHKGAVYSVAFNPNGSTLASGGRDGTILLWDTTVRIPSNTAVALSPTTIESPVIGEQLTLSLNIAAGQSVSGYQATVQFDPTALRFVQSDEGNYLPSTTYNIEPVIDGDTVTIAATTFEEESSDDGTLATIIFEAISIKASTISLTDVILTDSAGNTTRPRITASTDITVPMFMREDVNQDGVVNILDLSFIAANFGKIGKHAADVNADGVVNIVDLTLVAMAIGSADTAAPAISSLHPDDLPSRTTVTAWLKEARQLNLPDPNFQQGLRFLENLLQTLTSKETVLLFNYPNPFNPETWIPYHLATPSDVNISIYTSDGKLVRALKLGNQTVGIHQEHWDGKNAYGEQVASGIYFYTLRAGNYTATRKMTITK